MRRIPVLFLLLFVLIGVQDSPAQVTAGKPQTPGDSAAKSAVVAQREAVEAAMEAGLKAQTDSLQKQREALAKQSSAASLDDPNFIVPMLSMPQVVDCPALTAAEVNPLIDSAAQRLSLQPELIRAVIKQESGFKPCALSYKGAQGLMQLMPQTAWELNVTDPWDPKQNVDGGATLLKRLVGKYKGDLKLALAAYNAGANLVDAAGGVPDPKETQDYVASILSALGGLAANVEPDPAQSAPAKPVSPK